MIAQHSRQSLSNKLGQIANVANSIRGAEMLHRVAITANDTLVAPAVPTATAVTEAGSALANVPYHFAVAAVNRWGVTTATVDGGAVTPNALQALRIPVGQVAGATDYDIFLSTAAAPLAVGRISEAQRAAGDQIFSAVGVLSARAGAIVPGTIDVGIVGTGLAQNAAPYDRNHAFTPAAITPLDLTGQGALLAYVKLTVTDGRVAPNLAVRVFFQSTMSPGDWFSGTGTTLMNPQTASNTNTFETAMGFTIWSPSNVVVAISDLVGTGAAVTIWVVPI